MRVASLASSTEWSLRIKPVYIKSVRDRDAQASCASHPMRSSTGSPATDRDPQLVSLKPAESDRRTRAGGLLAARAGACGARIRVAESFSLSLLKSSTRAFAPRIRSSPPLGTVRKENRTLARNPPTCQPTAYPSEPGRVTCSLPPRSETHRRSLACVTALSC